MKQSTLIVLAALLVMGGWGGAKAQTKGYHEITAESGGFVDNGDGTIRDIRTGLMWQKHDSGDMMNLIESREYCTNLSVAGYNNWRLPKKDELRELYNNLGQISSDEDRRVAPFTWSGTVYIADGGNFIIGHEVTFRNAGWIFQVFPTITSRYVRAVRDTIPVAKSRKPSAAGGEISKGAYCNKLIGICFPVPQDWYVATDSEVSQLTEESAQVMDFGSPLAKAMVAQMPGKVLLVVYEHRLYGDFQGFNRNIGVLAINVRGHRDEIRTGEDYCKLVTKGIKESQSNAVVSEIISQRLSGEDFYKFDAHLPIQGITTFQRQLARIANDYLVVINMSAESSNGIEELSKLSDSLYFTPVSQAVDGSPEGQSFREQASFKITESVSTPSLNILQVIGIVGMAAGVIFLARVNPFLAIIIGGALFYYLFIR